jgi:hypothetical protein
MWKYKKEIFIIDNKSDITIIDKLNECGIGNWEAIDISESNVFGIKIGKYKIPTSIRYEIIFKKYYISDL